MTETLCAFEDLSPAIVKNVRVNGKMVGVVRIDDTVYAFEPRCPHFNAIISRGEISTKRHEIICPLHRFRYSLKDGTCVAAPVRDRLVTYPVEVVDGTVKIDLSQPAGLAPQSV